VVAARDKKTLNSIENPQSLHSIGQSVREQNQKKKNQINSAKFQPTSKPQSQ
jgi:hypothetical protein